MNMAKNKMTLVKTQNHQVCQKCISRVNSIIQIIALEGEDALNKITKSQSATSQQSIKKGAEAPSISNTLSLGLVC
jgi:hypothetical protein